ncbi:DUF2804 domain-containing protein [Alkalibacillus haloalkaliphilus]|uniref:DUF2804 domain-containing protein n=1 Tax=Alkalibacillus haloalkaliphilus TaxID=94136 RepID=A0A511W5Q9_9BACI|nr:DUF2804 domain-containing protein [Alkalibacillus haloalkaliphilus]GEN46307.1 hypothetical protein AHA02nite_20830 [Alkalibacillus haloalkaliphilus]
MVSEEILTPVQLCDRNGTLNNEAIGWSRTPLTSCNLSGSFLRKKKWNYWCFTSDEALFSVTISHLDYAAVIFAYVLDLETLNFKEQTVVMPFAKGTIMSDNVWDSAYFEKDGITVEFVETDDLAKIDVQWEDFHEGKSLQAHLVVDRACEFDTLNVVIPWSDKRFQFTSKQVALPVRGEVKWYAGTYSFQPTYAFATLDFGRGKWPYHSKWNWGAASGFTGDTRIGINLGGQWTDGTGQTENGLIIDGRLHKVDEQLDWIYDHHNYMKPWIIQTPQSRRIKLLFEPLFERKARTNSGVVKSSVNQLIGYYSGTVQLHEGDEIEITNLLGWAEDHEAKW